MITSHQNSTIKRIKRLKQKKYRVQEGAFFVEGLRVVGQAIEAEAAGLLTIEQIIWCDALLVSPYGRGVVAADHERCTEIADALFHTISNRDTPAGLGAIVRFELKPLSSTSIEKTVAVALFGVSDPGNLGTILRTMDAALGSDGLLILVGDTVDPFHPSAIKASMGAVFSVPMVRGAADDLTHWIAQTGVRTLATSAKATVNYRHAEYERPILLMMGSERQGLPENVLGMADQTITIPMNGTSSSLNLAVATGLLLYEVIRDESMNDEV